MTLEPETIFRAAEGIVIPMLLYGLKLMRDIRSELVELRTWRTAHDKQDDERYEGVRTDLLRLSDRIDHANPNGGYHGRF